MFFKCSSLTSLDLSNFDTSKLTAINGMFESCINLEYININNFDDSNSYNDASIFGNIPENIVICYNESIAKRRIIPQIQKKICPVIDCSNNWISKQKKLININNTIECVESCSNTSQYKYEYNGKCYSTCPNGFLYDEYNNITNKCKCELEKCLTCPNVALNKSLCKICNTNYYPKENDPLNIGEFINCYYEPEGYYLEKNKYKKCYHTCRTCNSEGNNLIHNCIECNDNFSFHIKINDYFNCYENCNNYFYFDNEKKFHCTLNLSCPEKYPKLKESNNECIKYVINDIIKILLENYQINQTELPKDKEIKYYDNIIQSIEDEFTSENYDTSKLDN